MTSAVTTSRLSKRHGSVWALRPCDLDVPAGRVVALVGPNGAGKTTLLQLISGLVAPTTGSVALFDERSPAESGTALARLGYVAQDHPLYPGFTVQQLLRLGRALNERWDQHVAERRLADLGIELQRRAGRLSGGQQAQVALVLALAKRPPLLLLDEPVSSLDPLARREFMQVLMATVVEDETTVLFSSHNVGELERVCDHLVLIAQGRVQVAGDIDDLLASHKVLTGPDAHVPEGPDVIHVDRADRHAHVVRRLDGAMPLPGWEPRSLNLEELVLAYLKRSQHPLSRGPESGMVRS